LNILKYNQLNNNDYILESIELKSIGLNLIGLNLIGLKSIGLNLIGLKSIGLNYRQENFFSYLYMHFIVRKIDSQAPNHLILLGNFSMVSVNKISG